MGGVQADLEAMGTVSKAFGTNYDQLAQAIQQLQNESETHSASWNGATKTAYAAAMVDVNNAWNKLNQLLDQTASHIGTSATNYGTTDTNNAQQVKSTSGAIHDAMVR